jgi:predicted permease
MLFKDWAFTCLAVLVLASGIGVNNTLFTIAAAVCLRGVPIDAPDRVMFLATRDTRDRPRGLSHADFVDARGAMPALESIAAFTAAPIALADEGHVAARFIGAFVSANALTVIREQPILGRSFRAEDDTASAPPVVILSHGVWSQRFGGDASVIGRAVRINGVPTTVIGVMRAGFQFPSNASVWQPLARLPNLATSPRDARTLGVMGRLVDGGTEAQAKAQADALAARLARDYARTNEGIRMTLVPINERFSGRITDPAWLAFVTVGLLALLIACANVANLLLSRAIKREREFAIRVSLGASRTQIVRQLLAESALLAAAAAAVGFPLSVGALRLFASALPEGAFPSWVRFTMDGRVFLVLAGACAASVLLFGLVPALHTSRIDRSGLLKEGGTWSTGGIRTRRLTAVFLTVEFAVTFILLSYVAVTVQSFRRLQQADLVIDPSNLLTGWVSLPGQRYRTADDRVAFYDSLTERLAAVPGVSSSALASALPFEGAAGRQLRLEGAADDGAQRPTVWMVAVDAGYFKTLQLPVVQGRAFTSRDGTAGNDAAIVNERFAALFFHGESPLGRRIQTPATDTDTVPWLTIVGVSPTVRQRDAVDPDPVVYVPQRAAAPPLTALIVRTPADPARLTSALREQLRTLDPDLPLYRPMTMAEVLDESRWVARLSGVMISIIAVIALAIACVGLYAVTAHAVSQRTAEIGVRLALGAQSAHVQWLMLRRIIMQLAAGTLLGLASTYAWQKAFLVERPDRNLMQPLLLVVVAAVLAGFAIAGSVWPVRRATRVDPVIALRSS